MDADAGHLLQRDLLPPLPSVTLPLILHKHAMEHDGEGKRRLELLQGNAEDLPTL